LKTRVFKNWGEILDEILIHLKMRQIDLTKEYNIERGTISNDRNGPMTRRKMLKYRSFIEKNDISEHFFLRGIYPILIAEIKKEEEVQVTMENLRIRNSALEATIIEKDKQIEMLKEALHLCIANKAQH